ncbi:hypothetical protein ACQR2B_11800 [Bradyrhizobium oligotrophicum]|uniref:hypothetical protein n=1 Tax=Bradyrhizobium TaxID=374 RepID=UPI0028E7D7FB|nr:MULTISPECIES: hypothetical protein [unclassified Bradyrhizobium]
MIDVTLPDRAALEGRSEWSAGCAARCRKAIGRWPVREQQIGQMRFYRIALAGKKSQT